MAYYANIVDGLVASVIVADAEFISTQPGRWVETFMDDPARPYAGVGHGYSEVDFKFKQIKSFVQKWNAVLGIWDLPQIIRNTILPYRGRTVGSLTLAEKNDLLLKLANLFDLVDENNVIR